MVRGVPIQMSPGPSADVGERELAVGGLERPDESAFDNTRVLGGRFPRHEQVCGVG